MEYVVVGLPAPAAQAAQEETEAVEEEKNPVLPAADELIWGAVAFAILFALLWKFVFPKAGEMLQARTAKIQGDLEKAEQQRREAEAMLRRYEQQLRDARAEAGRIIEEARKTAESMRRDLLAKAEEESRRVVARAQEEIRAERDRAFQELRRSVGELSVDLAARVVGESLDRERQERLVEEFIDELSRLGNGGAG